MRILTSEFYFCTKSHKFKKVFQKFSKLKYPVICNFFYQRIFCYFSKSKKSCTHKVIFLFLKFTFYLNKNLLQYYIHHLIKQTHIVRSLTYQKTYLTFEEFYSLRIENKNDVSLTWKVRDWGGSSNWKPLNLATNKSWTSTNFEVCVVDNMFKLCYPLCVSFSFILQFYEWN